MKLLTTNDSIEIPREPGIYKLINKINGKSYIGKSNNLRGRIGIHRNSSYHLKNDSYIKRAIIKYGWENFNVFIVHIQKTYDNDKLLKIEANLIKELNTLVPNGYNILASSTGCSGYHHTESAKQKIRVTSMGRQHTEKTKQILSVSHLGSKNPMYGKKVSNETKKKLSIAFSGGQNPFFGKTHSTKDLEKMRISHLGKRNPSCQIPVRQLDINTGNEIKIWDCASDASITLCGKKVSAIPQVCRKTPDKRGYFTKSALGFKWEYVTDPSLLPFL